jgi:hypothetical protein
MYEMDNRFPNAEDCAWMEAEWGYIGNPDDQSKEAQRMRRHLWRRAERNMAQDDFARAWEPIGSAIAEIPHMLFPWVRPMVRWIGERLRRR